MKKNWLIACLINFCIAALMGIILRGAYIFPIGINYSYLLHAHSHTVILGWCYLAVYGFIVQYFLTSEEQEKPVYNRLFWVTQIGVTGMMISFPFQGYAFISIFFSTLHILCSYYFCYRILRNIHGGSSAGLMLRTALVFMVLSTLGVWCLGPAAASGAKDSVFYNLAIQFYLHFQFNGWYLFVVLALFFHRVQKIGIELKRSDFQTFYRFAVLGCICTYFLAVGWYLPSDLATWVNRSGLLLQLASIIYLFRLLWPHRLQINRSIMPVEKSLYVVAFLCLTLKVLMQSATFWEEVAIASHAVRNFKIGFIHLTMLGIVNSFLFGYIARLMPFSSKQKAGILGIILFLSGFAVMEILLFYHGISVYIAGTIPQFYFINIFTASVVIFIGLLLILIHVITTRKLLP